MLIEPEDDSEEHFVDVDEDGTKPESSRAANLERDYDGKKREPQFAHADNSCLWDLVSAFTSPNTLYIESVHSPMLDLADFRYPF